MEPDDFLLSLHLSSICFYIILVWSKPRD